jgi:glutamine synthetase adenylyltransferase
MKTLLTASPSESTEGWRGIRPICGTPSAAVGDATSDRVPTAAIRHALRALASETGPLAGLRGVKLLRPLVAQSHEVLRERLEAGGSVEAYLRGRTRLADSAVVGLLHIASVSTRMRGGNMVAPLAAVAVGGYGRSELAPGADLDLLFLLPESNQSRAGAVAAATAALFLALPPTF